MDPSGHWGHVVNDPKPLIDGVYDPSWAGELPTTGAEPQYHPRIWDLTLAGEEGYDTKLSNNCYSYAANDLFGHMPDKKPQPGERSGQPYYAGATTRVEMYQKATVSNVSEGAVNDGFVPPSPYGTCDSGSYRVALFIDPYTGGDDVADYHWYRQDQGGLWSHKMGQTVPTNVDASANLIVDPRTADRNYGRFSYEKFGGFYCVPSQGVSTGIMYVNQVAVQATAVINPTLGGTK